MSRPGVIKRTVRQGALSIDVLEYADGRYGFEYRAAGEERSRVRVNDLDAAVERAKSALGATHAGKLDLLAIDPAEFGEFLKWKAAKKPKVTVSEMVESYIKSREEKGRSEARLRELRDLLRPFAKAFPGSLGEPTREGVERWLNAYKVGNRRWNNMRNMIVGLYRFARRDGAIGADLSPVEMIEPKPVTITVETYSRAELVTYLQTVSKEWRPFIILGAFAGIRPEEMCPDQRGNTPKPRLEWDAIKWEKKKIDVPAVVSKVRRRRFVPLVPAAADFLTEWKEATGPCVPMTTLYKRTPVWSAATGIAWKPDGWRHSYASYRLAVIKDIQELSLEMGNSPRMIHNHYLDLKHDDEGEAWFALRRTDVWKS